MTGLPPITPPRRIEQGDPITAKWGNSIARSIATIAGLRSTESYAVGTYAEPPFYVRFALGAIVAEAQTYYAVISPGVLTELPTIGATNQTPIQHEFPDLERETDGTRPQFDIAAGEAVFVKYKVKDTGAIDLSVPADVPQIVIADKDTDSNHYRPPVGDETAGDDATVYRKLAEIEIDDGVPRVIPFECGSNMKHVRQLPMFKKAGGDAEIFKEFDMTLGKFLTRGLTAGAGITLNQNADDIEIVGSSGWWGDVVIDYTPAVGSTDSLTMRFEGGALKKVFKTAGEVSGTEATPGNANLAIVDTDT